MVSIESMKYEHRDKFNPRFVSGFNQALFRSGGVWTFELPITVSCEHCTVILAPVN
jgi:hypothetical protein